MRKCVQSSWQVACTSGGEVWDRWCQAGLWWIQVGGGVLKGHILPAGS